MKTSLTFLATFLSLFLTLNSSEAKSSGTNIGGGNAGSAYSSQWCQNQSSLLRNVRDRAAQKLNSTSNYNNANKILNDGLIQALKNSQGQEESTLYRSLQRGLTIANYLGAADASTPEKKAMGTYYVLNNYYDFVLDVVAQNLEIKARLPYMQSGMDEHLARFEESFVNYASSQLQWILETMVREGTIGSKRQVTPVGETKSVFKVILVLSSGVAHDLEDSLWSLRFSCAISDLKILNETLGAYDQGNKEMFEDEKDALTYTVRELKRIARNLSQNSSCL